MSFLFNFFKKKEKETDPAVFAAQVAAIPAFAPIIVDTSPAGVQPLIDFVTALAAQPNTAAAARESERLQPYFSAMSHYLQQAIESNVKPARREKLKPLTTPGGLSRIFNGMAKATRNTLLSDVVILPHTTATKSSASTLFPAINFDQGFAVNGRSYNFGFLQVISNDAQSSTTVATFSLDDDMMKTIAPFDPARLLAPLQKVMTIVNHDMMHHLTSPVLNPLVAAPLTKRGSALHSWMYSLPEKADRDPIYEEWAHVSHEIILRSDRQNPVYKTIGNEIADYFGQLKHIGASLSPDQGHAAVDYFGMGMIHALTRLYPLHHPCLQQAIGLLQDADPQPDACLLETAVALRNGLDGEKIKESGIVASLRLGIQNQPALQPILDAYARAGLRILPAGDDDVTPHHARMLQAILLSPDDIRPHAPALNQHQIGTLQAQAPRHLLDMVEAAAKTAGIKPGTVR